MPNIKPDKFKTRFIILLDDARKALAAAAIQNAPIGIEVVLREVVKARGLDQNAYYWLRMGETADQAWLNGKQFDADTWHYYCGRKVMQETVKLKTGEERSKWVEAPDGTMRIISTTLLERGCFAEYTQRVEVFCANMGVMFSANPNAVISKD